MLSKLATTAARRKIASYAATVTTATCCGVGVASLATPSLASPNATVSHISHFLSSSRRAVFPTAFANSDQEADLSHGGMSPERFRPFRLVDAQIVSEDTCVYFFQLTHPEATLDMPMTSYVLAKANVDGTQIIRPYTPLGNLMGEFPLLVKSYPNGKLGQVFARLEIGDALEFKGPFVKYHYKTNEYDRLTLIAGGTGVTPMYQMIDGILSDENDHTRIHLLFANRRVDDILLKPVFDAFAEAYPDRFKVTYIVDVGGEGWNGPTGFINADLVNAVAGSPNPHHKVFVCGPPGLVKSVCGPKGENYTQGELTGILRDLGYTERDVYKF